MMSLVDDRFSVIVSFEIYAGARVCVCVCVCVGCRKCRDSGPEGWGLWRGPGLQSHSAWDLESKSWFV